MHEHYELIEA